MLAVIGMAAMAADFIPAFGSHKDSLQTAVAASNGQHEILPQTWMDDEESSVFRSMSDSTSIKRAPSGSNCMALPSEQLCRTSAASVQTALGCSIPCCTSNV